MHRPGAWPADYLGWPRQRRHMQLHQAFSGHAASGKPQHCIQFPKLVVYTRGLVVWGLKGVEAPEGGPPLVGCGGCRLGGGPGAAGGASRSRAALAGGGQGGGGRGRGSQRARAAAAIPRARQGPQLRGAAACFSGALSNPARRGRRTPAWWGRGCVSAVRAGPCLPGQRAAQQEGARAPKGGHRPQLQSTYKPAHVWRGLGQREGGSPAGRSAVTEGSGRPGGSARLEPARGAICFGAAGPGPRERQQGLVGSPHGQRKEKQNR
jgi:hypothetical protein